MAQDLNHVVIIGNVTRDAENIRYTQGGMAILSVSVANGRSRKNPDGTWGEETSFFDVNIFGKTAENLKPYLTKGKKIAVDGSLKQDRWQDQSGQNKSRVVINADYVQLVGGQTQQQTQQTQPMQYGVHQTAPQQQTMFPEDIPF